MRKIKEKKQTEKDIALKYANRIIATLREPFLVIDKNLRVVSGNRSFYTNFKVAKKETIGQLLPNLGNRQWNIPKLIHLLKQVLPRKTVVTDYEVEHKFKTLGYRLMNLNASQLRVPKRRAILMPKEKRGEELILLAIEDITERRKAEYVAKASELRYRRLFETAQDGILLIDFKTGMILDVNKFLIDLLGYSKKDFLEKYLWEVGVFKDIAASKENFLTLQKKKYVRFEDLPLETKTGKKIDVEFVANAYQSDDTIIIQCNIRDITERKKLERKLAEYAQSIEEKVAERTRHIAQEKAKNEAILASIGDAVMACDKKGKILLFGSEAEKLTGFSAKEVIGKHYRGYLKFVMEGNGKLSKDFIAETIKTGKKTKMTDYALIIRKDGQKIPVADSVTPIKDAKGKIIGTVVVFRDATRERELEKMKNEFISFASHQLRSPLVGIQWVVERILKKEKLTIGLQGYLQDIHVSVQRLSSLVNDLLNISRFEKERLAISLKQIDLVAFIKDYIVECTPLFINKGLALTFEGHPETLNIITDPNILRNVVQSLVSNALEYTPKKGKVKIFLKRKDGHFLFTVQDTGIGIPKEEQATIFEKFSRASNAKLIKPSGSGLGLYLAKQAAAMLGGKIWFESQENKGTTFYVELPLKAKSKGKNIKT